jgi:hypothetical protein
VGGQAGRSFVGASVRVKMIFPPILDSAFRGNILAALVMQKAWRHTILIRSLIMIGGYNLLVLLLLDKAHSLAQLVLPPPCWNMSQ